METIFKIEARSFMYYGNEKYSIDDIGSVYNIAEMYSNKSFYDIKSHIIPKIIETYGTNEYDESIHDILVTEYPLNMDYDTLPFISQYVFLPNGTLYVARDYEEDKFKGRKTNNCPLKIGDKVEYISGNNICKGVVYRLPLEEIDSDYIDDSYIILRNLNTVPKDVSDELYMLLHDHVDVTNTFKRTY